VFLSAANVYLKPDRSRTPLRTLEPGTVVKILSVDGDWMQIEFTDPQFRSAHRMGRQGVCQTGRRELIRSR